MLRDQTQVQYPIELMRFNSGVYRHIVHPWYHRPYSEYRADFIYMAPPFIAYFGALQGGDTELALIQVAYDQISLYRDALRDDNGLWRHIALGSWQDNTHWATGTYRPLSLHYLHSSSTYLFFLGNAWAAAGMLRVLQTLNHSSQAEHFADQGANLAQWIQEIITESWNHQVRDHPL